MNWPTFTIQIISVIGLVVLHVDNRFINITWRHAVFFCSFCLVGAMLFFSVLAGRSDWLWFAITFAIMLVSATIDMGPDRET